MLTVDSNVLISYLNDDRKTIVQFGIWRQENIRFFISVITEVELLSLPKLTPEDIQKIQRLLLEFTIIPLDSQLAKSAAGLRRQHGLRLADSVIVATAQITNSTLVTMDKDILRKARNIIPAQSIS